MFGNHEFQLDLAIDNVSNKLATRRMKVLAMMGMGIYSVKVKTIKGGYIIYTRVTKPITNSERTKIMAMR